MTSHFSDGFFFLLLLQFRLYSADCCFPQSLFLSLAYYSKRRFVFLYIPRALSVGVCGTDLSPNTLFKRNSPLLRLSLHAPIRVVSCLLRNNKYAICCALVLWRKVGRALIAAPCPSVSLFLCANWQHSFVRSEGLIVFCVEAWQSWDAYAELRKATISFDIPVRPSGWNYSASTGRIFVKFHIWIFFRSVEKIPFSLKSDKNNRYFTCRTINIFNNISLSSS